MGIIGNNFRTNFGVQYALGEVIARSPGNALRYSAFCNTRSQDGATTVQAGNAIPQGGYPSATFYPPQAEGQMSIGFYGDGTFTASLVPALQMSIAITGVGTLSADISGRQSAGVAFTGSGSMTSDIVAYGALSAALTGAGSLTAAIVGLQDMGINLTGSGTLSGEALLLISMLCDMSGAGTLSADIVGAIGMALDATGSGDLSAAINGRYDTAVAMTGSGSMTASMSALGNMIAMLEGSGDLEAAIGAIGDMSIDMTVTGTGLTTSNVGPAVWSALASENNDPDTMGRLLNLAGSGGVDYDALKQAIWEAVLSDYDTDPDAAASVVLALNTLVDEMHKLQGLDSANPMTVTPTTRTVGDIDLEITGDGVTTTTVTRT